MCTCTCCAYFTKLPQWPLAAAAVANGRPVPPHRQQQQPQQQQQHVVHSCNTSAAELSELTELPPTAAGDLGPTFSVSSGVSLHQKREKTKSKLAACHFPSLHLFQCISPLLIAAHESEFVPPLPLHVCTGKKRINNI